MNSEAEEPWGGADVGGPFLEGGATPTVADLMLLPFLERTEAVVPYFFGRDALVTSRVPFGRIARYPLGSETRACSVAALSPTPPPCAHQLGGSARRPGSTVQRAIDGRRRGGGCSD